MNTKTMFCATLSLLFVATCGSASAITIDSIRDIANGITIDFEEAQNQQDANLVLQNYGITASDLIFGIPRLTEFVSWVEGNHDAPIGGISMFGTLRMETTASPWSTIGLSGITTVLTQDAFVTMVAYDILGAEIETVTGFVDLPDAFDQDGYNDAAAFIGIQSDTPIYAIEVFADVVGNDNDLNIAWDNLTFVPVPIPAAGLLMAGALSWLGFLRRPR